MPTLESIALAKNIFSVVVCSCHYVFPRDCRELTYFSPQHSVTKAHSHDWYLLQTKMTKRNVHQL